MSELKLCPFHNCNTCGCYDAVDLADSTEMLKIANEALK
jgi:hypothetical protein